MTTLVSPFCHASLRVVIVLVTLQAVAAIAVNRGVLQPGGFHVIVDCAEFLRDFARYMMHRVFKNNFSPECSPNGMGEARSMVGMTLPAIPTVQSQKSPGFSMPKRVKCRAVVLILEDLGNGSAEHKTPQTEVGGADCPH